MIFKNTLAKVFPHPSEFNAFGKMSSNVFVYPHGENTTVYAFMMPRGNHNSMERFKIYTAYMYIASSGCGLYLSLVQWPFFRLQ